MSRMITAVLILVALISIVKNRFKLLNYFLSIQKLRELTVSLTMRIPFIRDKMLPQLFQSSRS